MKHTLRTLEDGIHWEDVLAITLPEAKGTWAAHRVTQGLLNTAPPLMTDPDANQKLAKDQNGWLAWSLSLAAHRTGGTNVCPASTPACRKHCVGFGGKGLYATTKLARQARVSFLMTNPAAFMRLWIAEIDKAVTECEKIGTGCAIRPNAFADIAWERVAPWMFDMFPTVQFYDYTKRLDRGMPTVGDNFEHWLPDNYSLTVSATERWNTNQTHVKRVSRDANVAVIFDTKRGHDLPAEYAGVPVVDGDKSDLRFKDPQGVIVGLRAKGTLRSDNSLGFAVEVSA